MIMIARLSPFLPALVVLFGAFWVAVGSFWAAYRQSNFNSDIRTKNEEIIRLQQDSVNSVTGGDSFAYVRFQMAASDGAPVNAFAMPDDLLLIPTVISQGKYPLYDVTARFVPLDHGKTVDLNAGLRSYPWGNLTSGMASTTGLSFPHHGKDIDYNVFFVARNGAWTQELRMRWVGDGWAIADRVRRGTQELFHEISPNYPREADGGIDWGDKPKHDQQHSETH